MQTSDNKLIRLGIVPYLNVQPLIWSLQSSQSTEYKNVIIRASAPRTLADELHRGEHDVAIVPVFEFLLHPLIYTIVPGASIAARREVYSVLLFSSIPLQQIRRIHLDTGSLTSINLLRVLLAERGLSPELMDAHWQPGQTLQPGDAALLIGDPAIQQRGRHTHQYDLGTLWNDLTGLPFVFAAWLVNSDARHLPLNALLLDAKNAGLRNIGEIAREAGPRFGIPADEALRYFQENLCYDLGDKELAGWRRFAELCEKHKLAPAVPQFNMHTA